MDSSVQAWLDKQCGSLPGARHGLVLLGARGGHCIPAAVWPADSRAPNEVYARARDTVLGKLPIQRVSVSETSGARIASTPIRIGDRPVGALAIAIDPAETASNDDIMGNVRRGLAHLFPILGSLPRPSAGSGEVLRLNATVLSNPGFAQACTAFANEVAAIFHCHRVSVGLVQGGMVRVAAVTHHNELVGGTEAFGEVEAAMEEAIDQAATILFPLPAGAKPRITLAHAALSRASQGALLTMPMVVHGDIVGAITLETSHDSAFNEDEEVLLEQIVSLLAPLLVLKREAEESAWQRLRRKAGQWWAQLRAPGASRQKLIIGGILATLLVMLVVPIPYRVTAPARVEGEVQRVLAAPTDGFLQQVHARPGDLVKEGQVLVELAQQDLLLERRKWQGEYAQHENAYGAAMAKNDRVQLAISMARMQEAQAQLDLVEQQLVRASLVAPFDGIVAEGDLTQSLGAPVQKGNKLMTVAPRDRYRIIVEVDERDIGRVSAGNEGTLAPTSRPGDRQSFRVKRITPVATVIGDRNVFEVEGALDAGAQAPDNQALRPGMKGAAKISVGWQPLGWVFFHRLGNWLSLNLWRWGL
jgi:hypothetical protein